MQFSLFFLSTLTALTVASPLLEERQNGAAVCGKAAAQSNCNIGSRIPFPTSGGGGCYSTCYCAAGGSHTFYNPCLQCVASYFTGTGGTNGAEPARCQSMLNGPCQQNNYPCVTGGGPTKE